MGKRIAKRIIVCCDGTWQDGVISKERWQYTNILRLSRMIYHDDNRNHDPPIPQIVFYQSGVGTDNSLYSKYIDGATAQSLECKVHEAYSFIAHNYLKGDEIYLFGFSRGAYTARMTAALIGDIGILNKQDMDKFGTIFRDYQSEKQSKDAEWDKISDAIESGRRRIKKDKDPFTIQCLGVFDTVGSVGLPQEVRLYGRMKRLFRFPDDYLGAHVKHAFHAMALDERRADFNVVKFKQTDAGRQNGQVLKQVWFSGCHQDIGGGYEKHDLADLTLTWMMSNLEDMLHLDRKYLHKIPEPWDETWGALCPHNPFKGIYKISRRLSRQLATDKDYQDHQEYIHPSARIHNRHPTLQKQIDQNAVPEWSLSELEGEIKTQWRYLWTTAENIRKDKLPNSPSSRGYLQRFSNWATSGIKSYFSNAVKGRRPRSPGYWGKGREATDASNDSCEKSAHD